MPYPNKYYGIIDNPIVKSPFDQGDGGSGGVTPSNSFLLLDGTNFLLLDGTDLLLLEA